MYMYMYIYVYIYTEREREKKGKSSKIRAKWTNILAGAGVEKIIAEPGPRKGTGDVDPPGARRVR